VIRRAFFGTFDICGGPQYVLPVVTMDCETATSCIVGAELPIYAVGFHALAAQAIVSRSVILGSRPRSHAIADFCDTTHCQFLRSPAARDSVAAHAVDQTTGRVLMEGGEILPARYCAACGGHTESGFNNGHRYVSVRCEVCRQKGTGRRGHGWGLCQEGAMELARCGLNWRGILAKYYPNASTADHAGQGDSI
jgi:peptidoglycan hydrolase-like amidase